MSENNEYESLNENKYKRKSKSLIFEIMDTFEQDCTETIPNTWYRKKRR